MRRSQRIINLVIHDNKNNRKIVPERNNDERPDIFSIESSYRDADRSSSPITQVMEDVVEQMQDVWNDVFSDNYGLCEDPLKTKKIPEDKIETCVAAPDDLRDADPYMPTSTITPKSTRSMASNQHSSTSQLVHSETSTPLTPIFEELITQPASVRTCNSSQSNSASPSLGNEHIPFRPAYSSPVVEDDELNLPIEYNTPVPSPVNNHKTCDDPFCCQHEVDLVSSCPPSVLSTIDSSNATSPAQPLIINRGKKRPRNHDNWGEIKRKKLTNLGKKYCSKRGHTVEEKKMGPVCRCRFKCSTKISNEERKIIFEKYWALGDREKQWLYVATYTTKQQKSRTFRRELKHNREFTYKYFLPKDNDQDLTNGKLSVCKTMFLNTLGISERLTRTAWQKYDGSTAVEPDKRGRHNKHKKVVNEDMIKSVSDHVKSFAPVESHYTRKQSKRLYLDGSLSLARMFRMYKEWPDLNKYTRQASTLRQYRDIVNTHFNLTFHVPKKDTCDQCHIFHNTENPSEETIVNFNKHRLNRKIARNLKKADKQNAIESNGKIVCATFDFQKVLTCPHGQMSILYYKRKLSCCHFTIYDMAAKKGHCYVWDESIAKRGANEVASCLYNFIKGLAVKGVKDFRFWSDNCAGQNRNRIVFAMFSHTSKELGINITHRFLEKGHTQNEGDSVHSVVERAAECKTIYTPEEWKLLIRWAKTTDELYEVIDVKKEMVLDFKKFLQDRNWAKNVRNEKVLWTKIKEIFVEENQHNKIHYKYNLNDNHMILITKKETRHCNPILPKPVYSAPIPIGNDKFKDLQNLCITGLIPEKYHDYFNSLPNGQSVVNEAKDTDDDNDSE